MGHKDNINGQIRGFYYAASGDDDFSGQTVETPKLLIQSAIDEASALSPVPSASDIALVTGAQGGSFTESFVLGDFIQFNGQDTTILVADSIAVTMASGLRCRIESVSNSQASSIVFGFSGLSNSALFCGRCGIIGASSTGINLTGTLSDVFVNIVALENSGLGATGIVVTSTNSEPLDINVDTVGLEANNTIFITHNTASITDLTVLSVSSVDSGSSTGTTAFNVQNGILVVETAGSISADTAIVVASGGTLTITSGNITGAITVESGGLLQIIASQVTGTITINSGGTMEADIINHSGTLTINGTLTGQINSSFYGDKTFNSSVQFSSTLKDSSGDVGTFGQLFSSTVTGTNWIDEPSTGNVTTSATLTDNFLIRGNGTVDIDIGNIFMSSDGNDLTVPGDITLSTAAEQLKFGTGMELHHGSSNGFINNFTGGLGITNTGTGSITLTSSTGGISLASNTTVTGLLEVTTGDIDITTATNSYKLGGTTLLFEDATLFNLSVGFSAGAAITTGSQITAVGHEAGKANTSGGPLEAFGYQALVSNTTGFSNTGIGSEALAKNTEGDDNVAIGEGALFFNILGSRNTALGALAGRDIVGATNTGDNTLLGHHTGLGLTTGIQNTIVGANVTGVSSTLSNNIILADGAGVTRLQFDSSGNGTIGGTLSVSGENAVTTADTLDSLTLMIGAGTDSLQAADASGTTANISTNSAFDEILITAASNGDASYKLLSSAGVLKTELFYSDLNDTCLWESTAPLSFTGTSTISITAQLDMGLFTNAGKFTFQTGVNSTTAWQVLNSSSSSVINVDTTNSRFGIGLTDPDNDLHVDGNVQIGANSVDTANRLIIDSGGNISHTFGATTGGSGFGRFQILNNVNSIVEASNNSGGYFTRNNTGDWAAIIGDGATTGGLKFFTGGSSTLQAYDSLSATLAMTIDESQDVSIVGDTTIGGSLSIGGENAVTTTDTLDSLALMIGNGSNSIQAADASGTTANISTNSAFDEILITAAVNGDAAYRLLSNNGTLKAELFYEDDNDLNIWFSSVDLNISSNADLTIGSQTAMDFVSSTSNFIFKTSTNSTTAWQMQNSSSSIILNIDSTNKRVGILEDDPQVELDVAGDFYADGIHSPFGGSGRLQNLLEQSEDLSTTWSTLFGTVVVANAATAPNGETTADTVDWSASTSALGLRQSVTLTQGNTYTVLFWARTDAVTNTSIRVDLGDGSGVNVTIDSTFHRYSLTMVAGAANHIDFDNAVSGSLFEFWGIQLVEGSEPMPYVRTEANSHDEDIFGESIAGFLRINSGEDDPNTVETGTGGDIFNKVDGALSSLYYSKEATTGTEWQPVSILPTTVDQLFSTAEYEALGTASVITTADVTRSLRFHSSVTSSTRHVITQSSIEAELQFIDPTEGNQMIYIGTSTFITAASGGDVTLRNAALIAGVSGTQLFDCVGEAILPGVDIIEIVQSSNLAQWNLGTINRISTSELGPIVRFKDSNIISTTDPLVLDACSIIEITSCIFADTAQTGSGGPLFSIKSSSFKEGRVVFLTNGGELFSGESLVRVDAGLSNDYRVEVIDSLLILRSGASIFDTSGATGTFTAVANNSVASTTITSVISSSGVALFGHSGTNPNLGSLVTTSGFTTNTTYNTTGIITEINDDSVDAYTDVVTGAGYLEGEVVTLVGGTSGATNAKGTVSAAGVLLTITNVGSGYTSGETVTLLGAVVGNNTSSGTITINNRFGIDYIAFVADEASLGSYVVTGVTVTATAHGLTIGTGVTLDTTDSAQYDGGFLIYNIQTNSFDVPGTFDATEAGTWSTKGLDQSDPRVRAFNNPETADSHSIACASVNANSTATGTIVNNTFTDMVFGTSGSALVESSSTERAKLINDVNGTFENKDLDPFSGLITFDFTVESSGGTVDFRFKWQISTDGGSTFSDLADAVESLVAVGSDAQSVTKTFPLAWEIGDQIKPQITRNSGSSGITTSYATVYATD